MSLLQRIDDAAEAHKAQHAGLAPRMLFLGLKELGELKAIVGERGMASNDPQTYTLVAAINWQGMSVQAVLTDTLVHVQ